MQQALSQSFLKMTEFISLYTWCKENKKEWLVEQWDYKKNYPLTPKDISFGSTKAVAWIYEYVDDKSVITFQWTNSPNRRTIAATRSDNVCPFINGNVLYNQIHFFRKFFSFYVFIHEKNHQLIEKE